MSSSADFSDEDDYSLKSGSVSPAPGDTLPWNLPRHERHKRQIQGGSVLDPAERAVLRIADERDRVQKKTFTKWINQHLLKVRKHVNDLYEDLRDGHNLISLLEVLTGQSLPREKGRMRFHRLQNVQIALDFLKRRQVKLVNIRNDDITDGNPKLTLGLIWTIILHFQISEIHVCGESEDMTAKERLLMWSQQMTEGYVGVRCDNFTSSWRDGRLFNAIIHKYRPDLVDMARVSAQTSRSNLEQAFGVAERLGVARLLDPEDVDVQTPDEKSVITYVSTLYDVFPKVPDGVDGINANDVDIKWVEYQNMVNYLSQWLKHNVSVMSDRAFPNNPVELKALYTQYLQFKENEIPLKETEKSKIKHLYKMLEVWIEFGRIQLPQGYHPNDVEKEWGKLIVAMLEREKSLRPEVDRLEMLQQIASRVQRDCVNGEDKLELARAALQSDAKRLESGVQFQNEAETAGHLLECENLLRQQVVDIQILLDGKYYYSDQLVQRVSKLRDDLLGLRAECSSVYRQGRTLTPQQTTMMISGITQSLNSGFSSSNLNSSLTPGGLGTPGSTFTSILTPGLTPALSPAMTPGGMQPGSVQAYMGGGGVGMAPGDLQHLKHMQIRKPLCKSSLVDPNMTEDEVNINFVQDLINWVEEMQVQLDRGDWGSDLPSVETHLENHKGVHRAIEEFQMSLKEAKLSETQMTQKRSYSEKLGKLETQYGKLLNCSRERQKNLESLHDFVSRATMELIWLNEKEEEEVAFDWSDLNGNISKKRQYHSDLMRELDEKEEVIKSVQDRAENLLQENHPARLTLEAYKAAMQTQWSWILQLCSCVEQHLKDNTVYFEFFNNAKESTDYLKSLQGDIQRKYGCDRTSSVHKLEDHIQESMDEKEQLLQYRSTVAGLVGKAKAIVQLKPRNPDTPVRSSIPVKAICDYRQIEITIYKDDECVLASNSHRAKWKVISPSGNEAMVPSVCFTVPPPNKEAVDQASRIEQLYQNVLALWHHSHIKMKSVVSWHYLMADVRAVRDWNVSSIKTMLPGEHQQVLSNLQSHFEDFLEDSKESEVFTVADCSQLEREVLACKDYYEELLKSAEREEHEESVYNLYISEVRNFRMRLEAQEEHLIRQIRTPLDRDDLEQSVLRITEQEKKKAELDQLKDDLETMKEKCETFFRQAGASPAVPTLSSDLNVLIQSMSQVYSMSAIYLEKLKTVSMVVRHSQSAEALVKLYEAKLSEEDAVNSDLKSIDTVVSTLKQWRSEIDEQREIFHDLEDGLQKARGISERMFKAHNERDFDLDWHKEKADQLEERWSNVHSQIESRLRDLEGISKSLKYYKDSYGSLDEWVREMEAAQLKTQEKQPEDSKALAELVNQQKVLVAEMEQKQSRIDECQKYSEQYSSGAKDYELQLLTYRAMVDSQHKSPLKRRRMQNSADAIIQEFMDLRTRYTAVVTSMTQYVKFASETLKRAEGEERSVDEEKKEHGDKVSKLLNWMSSVKPGQNKDGKASTEASSKPQVNTVCKHAFTNLNLSDVLICRMTEEEKLEAKEQLKSLHQAYSDLTQQCSDQTPSAEQFRMCLELDEAFHHNLIDEATWKQLRELNEANRSILSPPFSSEPLPVMAALREGAVSERLAMKVIEIQLATGGLRVSYTGDVLTLERAFQFGLIPAPLYVKLLERQNTWKDLINPGTAEKVSLTQLVQRSVVDEETGLRLLPVKKSHNGGIELTSGREMSVLRAVHEGLIDREITLRLLVNPQNGKRLTVDEAVQCDLMSFSSALLVLEKQKGLMGLLWPHSGEILTVSTSLQHEIITSQLAFKLLSNRQKIASLYIPEYSEVVDINSATQNGFIDVHTAEVLKTIEIPDVFPDVDDLNDRFSNWLMLRELQIGGSHRSTDDNEIDYENINTPSSIEAKQLFISYLTMNSYMDPKSGQRLLIFDGQLTKMVQLLVDISVETTENQVYNTGPGNATFEDISLKEDISEDSEMSFDSNTEDFGYLHINEETDGTVKDHHASNFFKEEESDYKQSDNQAFSNNVVKVVAHDGTEDFPSAIDCVNNTTLPDSDISIYQKNTSSIPIGIDVESSDNQSKETFTGSSATQTPSTDMSLSSGALDCKMMIAHDFTEKFHSSVKNTRQHDSVLSDGPSPFEIGLETSDKALYNQSIGESATQAMSESSTRTKSCSVSGKDISLLAQCVTDEASVAVHSEKNARQPDSKDNVLSNSTYQKTRHSTNPSSFEIGVETSEIPSDYQPQETVNGVSVLESSAPPRLCFVNDTDMRLTSEASVEVSSCKNTRTSPALTEIDLVTSETYSDNQPKDTANGVSATQTILESSTPRFCTVDSKKTIQQSDSEAIVSKKKKINNTSIVPFEIDVETSHITSDNQPQEAFTFNEGSATQIILERSTHPLLCSVNDDAQHSKMEVAHSFRDESPISIDSEQNTRQPSFEMGVVSDRIYQTNTMSTSPTPFKMDSETDIASDNQPKGTFNGSSATQTVLKSSTLCSRKDTGLPLASVAQGSPQRPTYPVTPGCETDKDTNFESSLLATVLTDTLDTTTAFPCTEEVVWDNTDERGLATHLLRPQVEEGGILYIISEKRCDLDSPFDKGHVDEETVLEVSALQLHKGDVLEEERSTVATLKEVVSESSISSQIALQIMEQHSILGGVHDPKSGCTVSVSAALDSAMIDDDLAEKILHSDPVHKAIIHPDRHCTHSMSYSQSLGLIDNDEAENLRQHQTDKKLSVLVLDDSDDEEWIENRDGHAREDLYAEGSKEQNCDSQKALLPSFTISHGPVCRQIISPILSDQVTEGRVIHELETTSSFREDSASHSPTSPLSDIVPGSRNSIQNDILPNRSNSLSLSDSGDSGAPQRQAEELRQTEEDGSSSLRRDTDMSCEAVGFTPGDGQLGAGYREIVGDQTVSPVQSDSGVSCSSHSDLLSDERKMENTVQAPASQLVKESDRRIDSSSPRDLSGGVTSTVSGDVGVSGDKSVINGDGVSSFNTVRPLVKSERDVGGEIEPTSSQNGHSDHSNPTVQKKTPVQLTNLSDLAIVSSVHSIKSGNDNKDSYDIGDQEQLETAPIKEISSTITPDSTLTDKRLPNSNANVEAKANDRVESSRSGDSKPGRQEGSSDDGLSQITDQATSQTGQTSSNDTSLLSASTMTPGNPSKAKEPGMRSDVKQDECGSVDNHPQPMATNAQPDSHSNTPSTSEMTSGHPVKPGLGSELTCRQNQCGADGNHPHLMTVDVPPDSMTHDSVPPPVLAIYTALRTGLDELVRMRVEGADVDDLQKAETQAVEDIINLIQDIPQSHGSRFGEETDAAPGVMISSSPDLLRDLLKQEPLRSGKTSPAEEEGEPLHEETPTSDVTQIQSRLLQVLQSVSSSQDPAMLRDVIGTLSSILGGAPHEDRPHNLEILQEESSSDEAEEVETISDTGNAEAVQSKYSTQDYLECVGRLQDHADVLEEIMNVLSSQQGSLSNNMEELHSHLDESQPLLQNHLKKNRLRHLEDTAFDIQYFISEHAQFLSPTQSRHLLKSLSATQRAFKEQMERVAKQRRILERHLEIREDESQQKYMEEKQKVFSDKLQELCDNLTNTENRLIGHQQQTKGAASVEDLQHVQQEHQALQKDILTNGSALNEVISSSKKFLDENRSKLTPDQIIAIESKLEDAKSKVKLINQRAEESRKDLEKSVTTAIKQETEKEAAVEQLEESKNKIEGLLDWINNMGNEKVMGGEQTDHMGIQNGNMPLQSETSAKNILGEDDDPNGNNGNAFQTTDNDTEGQATGKTPELDLEKQYDRVKARHQEILSQQQELIMATQSAQALLDHQAHALSPTDKDKLQRDIQELKGRYDSSLTQAEQQMKQMVQVQEELKKFQGDCEEFEGWLQQAEGEVEELGAPTGALNDLTEKLRRQKSFSDDVISHKGDLRFITISGQKVLDVAKACGRMDPGGKDAQLEVDTTATCAAVKEKLDSAAGRFKALHSQCNDLGNNLRDVVDKYKKYEDSAAGLLKWLNNSEEDARRQQSEAIAADPQTLQKQLEDTKGLQGQTTGRQTAVETLRKTADSLVTAQGDLLTNQDHIHETVDDIVERYDNLSKSVSDRNEKLQITLTRSLSVQDGLDEMMSWMEGVEESVKEKGQVPLDSAVIGDVLSKEAALEQDISSRQSSISAMKAKVKKFVETADPAAAALLQSKMDALSQRFSDACDKHKHKQGQLEQLKDKVEEFEKTTEKVQQFVLKRSQALSETDGPGKNVNELSQLMQVLAEHAKDVEMLQMLSKELANMGPEGSKAQIQSKMDKLSDTFNAFKNTVKEKEEEVSSCQDQLGDFRAAAGALRTWLEETTEKVPVVQPTSSEQSLGKDLQRVNALMEEWTTKGSAVEDINSKGSALCCLISVLTSPAKTKMSHKSAVTNSDGPGNHAYLTNKELMVVQQNMSYINEGHKSLGEVLKGRATELSVLVQEVTEAQKETDTMITWLQDMKKTAASWNSASTEKDTMKTQLEQQKAFEEDMKQKHEQLQKLREKLLHLIEKHPDSPEAAKWKQMLSQIDTAWADVSGSVEDRKQRLEESNRNLDVFQTTEPQLRQWLSEKDMMLSVLGPLSMDPNMLNTQKQQVQILLNEFDSRKPQFDQLHEAAAAILSTSGKQDPPSGGKVVKDQLAAVTQKWQGLTGQLGQRAGLIDQAVGKSIQFQDLLMSLSQSAASLETRLNSQQALSSQPDVVKKQLEEANTISGQLREERKRLKEAETLCSELSALVTEDYLKAGLDRQLEGVNKPFKQLEDKAGKRIQQLNSAFASSQQFHQASKDFQGWMNGKLQEQSKPQAISAQVETLRQSLKEQSALQKALSEHEEPYSTIVREGETLLQNTDGAEKVAMQGQLATLRSNWDDVKKSSAERQDKLQGALQRAQKYHEHAEKLQSWVQECEVREGSVRLSVDPAEVESSISQLKAIQKDVDKHRGLVEQLNTAADSLLEVANADTEAVREEKAAIGQSVDRVTDGVQNKRESLEKISQRLKEFNDTHNEAKGQLAGAKKQLDAHTSLGVQAYSNKNLTNMKAQQKSLDGVNTQVEHLKSLAQGLVADVPEADGVTDLLLQADSLEKEHGSLSKDVGETCSTLEGKLQGIGQFQTNIREMFTRFADLDDELDSMASVGRDLITLKEQQDGIKGFVEKLQGLMADTARGGDSCKKMLETEASPDLLGLKRDLDGLSKQCGKLMDRAKGRGEEVGSTLTRLDELYSKLQQFTNKLGGAEVKEEGQGSVGMETDVINQQLEAFKVFQKEVDPLQSQLQDINWLGQGLIQNADKGTSTKGLEHDLEDVNTRWNTLNKKIAERSVQLHEALLHCGRFQDALESLLSWLTDTEDLVSNQKPPSAEFKVVKAQIQEQILLQRLLDDRRPTVELIKKEGGKVAELGAESVDKEKVGKEIECLGQRWDALLKKAENRHKQLKSILVVAQQFHETLEPLSEWLSATEKHLAKAEPIGTQTSKLEEQISQHKVLEEEITGHCKDLVQAVNLGQMLKLVSSVDDKELVQSKLDSSQASYVELQERCRRKGEMLQQALANAQLFGEDEVALMNWLNEVHTRLSEVSVKDYKTDVLEKQCAEQLALHEDIELRKQNVDQAISNGLELLKQTTGDEVVVIQGKLDGIKTRYAEINSMSGNVSETLNQALTLASKLQHTHEDLSSWLENVEAELTAFAAQAPVGEQLVQAQDRQKALLQEARDHKPQVDKLNEVSSSLLELVPWRAREGLDKIVTEDNDRYKATSDTIAHHAEQIDAAILKSQQFEQAADTELAWLTEAERKMLSLGEIRLEQDQTTVQLQSQKGFSMDIMRHKDAVDGIVKTGEAIMNSKDEEEKQALKAKIQALLEKYVVVSQLNSERCLQLERAQSLASQFWETYEELWPWLQETRTSFSQLPLASIEYEALRQQQEELRQMRELIAEHKPYIDKMNKTGPQLLELSPVAGVAIREKYTATDLLYAQLKADVKQRAFTLDEAISKSTQFHDKIEPMLESLERIAERLRQPPSISVEVEKIREQITENKVVSADLEKLQPSYDTLKQRGEEMIARSAGADKDISAKAVQDKLDRMVFTWNEIHALMEEREAKLLDVMDLADKFWCDHCALIVTIKDTQDLLRELEEPGVDPSVVKQQQEYLESFKEEIDGLQEELDVVRNLGAELMAACGEPDKPVTKKSIDEVNLAWETLNKAWKERVDTLDEAMQAAVQFQDGLQVHYCSLWINCSALSYIRTCSEFKGEAYQLQMEMERLNHQAGLLLKKVTEEYDRCAIQEPMTELKMLWDNLDEKIINRQHKLEGALLALGQFQHALDELLAWMSNTEELLNEQRKAVGDPKAIEIKLAKHHVLQNDVLAHKTTVEAVNKAGTDLVESTSGEEAAGLQNKLENLTQRWKNILEKTEQRRQQLDSALLQAQGFHGEMEDMQQWLKDTERQLLASKAVGGLPDTAREQLNAHLELCSTMEAKEELYQQLMNKGQQLLTMTPSGQDSNTEQDLRNLQDKWESVQAKVAERKVKLEEALALATEFHNSLQDFISWLTQAEQTLTMSSPASVILETILFQIDEHKVFVTEVNSHRQQIIELDKTGTHLKYFSQKQDVVLIKNLLISVQGRWEKVVQRSVERGRLLDDTRKRAKQFHETWNKLTEWLDDSEKALDSELEIANDPDKIKTQLAQHKEFQKVLGSKHSVYDTTSRTGRALKDKTSLQDDNQKLDDMLSELRDKWDTVCGKSVERQNKLEEALLFSGQFTDALQALIDWLYRVEPQLAEDQPVHGDIDLVLNLIDSHKVFQKELGKRTGSVAALKRSAKDLIESSHEDSSWVKAQMQELSARWETVCARSVSKQTRLEQALSQAEEFHSTVHMLLEWLAEAEQSLRFHGTLPDDEEALGALIEQHKEFMKKQEEKRVGLNKATSMGEAILTICHPDSITTIKHWNTIIKARFEEVQAWARQHQQRLAMALGDLLATKELLEGLLGWLQWAETTLNDKDKEVIPQEIDEVKSLIAEHQVTFMEEMTRKQPDVDKVTKTHKRKAVVGSEPASQSHIPVLEKGRGGRKRSPTQAMYPSSQPPIETKNPRVNLLVSKWQQVWLLALDRRRKLNDAMDRLEELKEFANFDFDVWRKRYMRWMNHKKSRVMDFFRRIDKDQDGKVTRQEFIEGILSSKFPTSRLEMSAVADIFDRDGDGYIDYYEFVAALHPNKEAYKPLTDADKIEDEVTRQVAKCKCPKRFQVEQIGANKYRFYLGNQFGDSQQLRLVRILRSTVMVRVGGGWMALDEFLVKNDPCRAKGRTNMELREKFILPEGTTQMMASFRYRGRRSRPSSRAASPNRSNSNHSCPAQHNNPALTSTPKTPQHITRNYDKPWLTNSKPSSPLKSSDSFESQGSSSESIPIQGSKLRLPGYLSGKGFQSGEEQGTLINAAVMKARGRPGSRPGSKAGSRGSSRRGSDASDFDISDIASVCSETSEMVGDTSRATPRSSSRQHGGKPSKIPTPQRRLTPSKLAKTSKR
uniref:Dystonin n=1 Tax=Oncorhynchus kisutch TaxID=8019 RepID=A0A8C7LGL6_ONCKI